MKSPDDIPGWLLVDRALNEACVWFAKRDEARELKADDAKVVREDLWEEQRARVGE